MVLRLRQLAPDWGAARCLGQADSPDCDPWFDNSEYGYPNEQDLGLAVCNGEIGDGPCPIRHDCLSWALLNNERYGIWGGTSEADRRAIRKMWPWPGGNEPHPAWRWYPPGEVASMLPARTRAALEEDDEDDE